MQRPLRFWYWFLPYTFDTYKADNVNLMLVAKNIYAPLVSTAIDGIPQGMIAKDWEVDPSGRIWRFTIRPGLTFDDGTPITPEVVLNNFRRMLWLTRTEGLLLNSLLSEVKTWRRYSDPVPSLYTDGNCLVFKLIRRPVNFFETLEQPIYGIADPKCFNANREWKDPKCISTSGQYRVQSVTGTQIVLASKHVFPETPTAPETVEVNIPGPGYTTALQTLLEDKGDLTIRYNYDLNAEVSRDITAKGLKIVEEPKVRMHFLQLNAIKGPFKDNRLRRSFRGVFLSALRGDSSFTTEEELNTSFIPRGGPGYKNFTVLPAPTATKTSNEKITVVLPIVPKTGYSRSLNTYTAVEKALFTAIKAHKLTATVLRESTSEWAERRAKNDFDAGFSGSGILINNPYVDLRMMFMSRIGADIPDPSGKIPGIIEKAEVHESPAERQKLLEDINSQIFDDASVITYMHSGKVYIHRPGVDLSRVNLFTDPLEFRAIGWRPNGEHGK